MFFSDRKLLIWSFNEYTNLVDIFYLSAVLNGVRTTGPCTLHFTDRFYCISQRCLVRLDKQFVGIYKYNVQLDVNYKLSCIKSGKLWKRHDSLNILSNCE